MLVASANTMELGSLIQVGNVLAFPCLQNPLGWQHDLRRWQSLRFLPCVLVESASRQLPCDCARRSKLLMRLGSSQLQQQISKTSMTPHACQVNLQPKAKSMTMVTGPLTPTSVSLAVSLASKKPRQNMGSVSPLVWPQEPYRVHDCKGCLPFAEVRV